MIEGHDFLIGLSIGAAFGGSVGLWVGFKLWKQTYVKLNPLPGRGWLK